MKDVYQWIKEDFVIYPSNLNNKLDDLIMNEEKHMSHHSIIAKIKMKSTHLFKNI